MRDCPGPEHGVFCISIVDRILRSALAGFSLLCVSNYYYRKGLVIVDIFTILAIYGRLFCINLLQSLFPWWEINFVLFMSFLRIGQNIALYIELQLYLIFCHFSDRCIFYLFFSRIESVLFCYFCNYSLSQSKNSIIYNFIFQSTDPALMCYMLVIR